MLEDLLNELVSWLCSLGFSCKRDFSEDKPYFVDEGMVYLDAKELFLESSGLMDYLGLREDLGDGFVEVYGKRARTTIKFNIISPYSLGQEKNASLRDELCCALISPPEYLKVLSLGFGETKKENGIQAFVSTLELSALGFFEATKDADNQEEFLDFILKGVIN